MLCYFWSSCTLYAQTSRDVMAVSICVSKRGGASLALVPCYHAPHNSGRVTFIHSIKTGFICNSCLHPCKNELWPRYSCSPEWMSVSQKDRASPRGLATASQCLNLLSAPSPILAICGGHPMRIDGRKKEPTSGNCRSNMTVRDSWPALTRSSDCMFDSIAVSP